MKWSGAAQNIFDAVTDMYALNRWRTDGSMRFKRGMIAFIRSVLTSREWTNSSFVLFSGCCLTISDLATHVSRPVRWSSISRSSRWKLNLSIFTLSHPL